MNAGIMPTHLFEVSITPNEFFKLINLIMLDHKVPSLIKAMVKALSQNGIIKLE